MVKHPEIKRRETMIAALENAGNGRAFTLLQAASKMGKEIPVAAHPYIKLVYGPQALPAFMPALSILSILPDAFRFIALKKVVVLTYSLWVFEKVQHKF